MKDRDLTQDECDLLELDVMGFQLRELAQHPRQ